MGSPCPACAQSIAVIGTEGYAEQNQSYGLATILKEHVRLVDGRVVEEAVLDLLSGAPPAVAA